MLPGLVLGCKRCSAGAHACARLPFRNPPSVSRSFITICFRVYSRLCVCRACVMWLCYGVCMRVRSRMWSCWACSSSEDWRCYAESDVGRPGSDSHAAFKGSIAVLRRKLSAPSEGTLASWANHSIYSLAQIIVVRQCQSSHDPHCLPQAFLIKFQQQTSDNKQNAINARSRMSHDWQSDVNSATSRGR